MTKITIAAFSERSISYQPMFARISGRAANGIFLSQLFYWTGRGKDPEGWIWKTQQEWYEETMLTRAEQETARRALTHMELLEEKRAGIPARLYYRLNLERLAELCEQDWQKRQASGSEDVNPDCGIPANKEEQNAQSNSEITTQTSSQTTIQRERPAVSPVSGPLPKPQLVQIVKRVSGRTIPKSQWARVIKIVGEITPEKEALIQRCADIWITRGHNPSNFEWLTDWVPKGGPPGPPYQSKRSSGPAKYTGPQSTSEWTPEKALKANEQMLSWMEEKQNGGDGS